MKTAIIRTVLPLLLLALVPLPGEARTWVVKQDGSGDWMSIQAAVEASADGDTIWIGAGRYDQLHYISDTQLGVAFWPEEKGMHFIGESRDEVIIGPSTFLGGYGICIALSVQPAMQTFRNMTFVNCQTGVQNTGSFVIENCLFQNCEWGIFSKNGENGYIRNCTFEYTLPAQNFYGKAASIRYLNYVEVTNCLFKDLELYLQSMPNSLVSKCEFSNLFSRVGSTYVGCSGEYRNNVGNSPLIATGGSHVVIRDNVFNEGPGQFSVDLHDSGTLGELYGNILNGGSLYTLGLVGSASCLGSGNHLLKGSGEFIVNITQAIYSNYADLRDNYWGTTSENQIAAWIWDKADDPSLSVEVQYLPFSSEPLPTEKQSLGGFRAMFR